MDIGKHLKPKHNHKHRTEMVRNFAGKNKIFTVIAAILLIFLLSNFIVGLADKGNKNPQEITHTETVTAEKVAPKNELPKWEFHMLDLWILGLGGGFCVIMILKEKAKAREKL